MPILSETPRKALSTPRLTPHTCCRPTKAIPTILGGESGVNPLLDPLIHPGLPPVRGHRVGLEHRHLGPVLREKLLHPLGDVPGSGMGGVDQHLASRRRRPVLWRWGTVLWDATGRHSYLRRDRHRLCVQAPLRGKRQSGLLRVRCLRTDIRFRSVTLQWRTYKGTCGLRALAAILDLYAEVSSKSV